MSRNFQNKALTLISGALSAFLFVVPVLSQDKTIAPGVECSNPDAHRATQDGFHHSDKGDHQKALISYLQAVNLEPTCAATYHNLGNGYFRLDRHLEAIQAYRRALQFRPSWAWTIYNAIGRSLSRLDRIDEAIGAYSQAISLEPKEVVILLYRAILYFRTGRGIDAAADARTYLKLKGVRDKTSVYAGLLAYLGYRQADQADSSKAILEELSRSSIKGWPMRLLQYLRREITEQDLIGKASNNDEITEARSYVGLDLLFSGKHAEAMPHLEWVKENGKKTLTEYRLVVAELQRLSKKPSTN
jgi:tetratricopeptide (TPR) repeat protein